MALESFLGVEPEITQQNGLVSHGLRGLVLRDRERGVRPVVSVCKTKHQQYGHECDRHSERDANVCSTHEFSGIHRPGPVVVPGENTL